jgi:hypothetical protein
MEPERPSATTARSSVTFLDEATGPDISGVARHEHIGIFEVWDHDFHLETCCQGLHEQLAADMNDDPAWARQFLRSLNMEPICGHALRRVADDGCCGLVLDFQLRLKPVPADTVRRFIARHHAHCGAPVIWRFHQGVFNGATLIGVAVVGNPVAPAFMGRGIVEVTRLCIRRDMAAALRWSAASMLYGWCAREAQKRGWKKIITYTRADESGKSVEAAGWGRESPVRGRGWHSARRPRSNRNSFIDKVRWSRTFPASAPTIHPACAPTPCTSSTPLEWTMNGPRFG